MHLSIVTAEQSVYEGEIESLVAPAVDGEVGILQNHHPLVTKLGPGQMKITKKDKSEQILFVAGGYLEVSSNNVIVLADIVEDIEAITLDQAKEAREKAKELLKHAHDEVERETLEKEIQLQMVRERLASIHKFSGKGGMRGKEEMTYEQGQP